MNYHSTVVLEQTFRIHNVYNCYRTFHYPNNIMLRSINRKKKRYLFRLEF